MVVAPLSSCVTTTRMLWCSNGKTTGADMVNYFHREKENALRKGAWSFTGKALENTIVICIFQGLFNM